ncbi:MAG: YheT family hydrolase [Desulfosoma sp.]|uniref:YheT family hydrolase n=1 Tax=Desulfosoma sp. TaxID=2603217 RepID=UPI00404A204A
MVLPCSYQSLRIFRNPHVHMVVANQLRYVSGVRYRRTRLETPDGDFLDLDFSCQGFRRIAVIVHGLEGHSHRPYVLGMVRALQRAGWDACAVNLRGCSGEPNRKPWFYHSGMTEDLETVLRHLVRLSRYESVALVGFGLGGNLVLKYLGERGLDLSPCVQAAVTFAVPCDLAGAARKISEPQNRLYLKRFLKMLRQKIEAKARLFPDRLNTDGYEAIRTLEDLDNRYTAPLHGFQHAQDYYARASCNPFSERIAVPTLLINALDDPFLSPSCFAYREAFRNPHLILETPDHGSHVGFVDVPHRGALWSERRAVAFLQDPLMP